MSVKVMDLASQVAVLEEALVMICSAGMAAETAARTLYNEADPRYWEARARMLDEACVQTARRALGATRGNGDC